MMRPGVHAEQRRVQHVAEPRDRVVVGDVRRVKSPLHAVNRQLVLDDRILRDVIGIVAVNKAVVAQRQICRQRQRRQQHAQHERALTMACLPEPHGARIIGINGGSSKCCLLFETIFLRTGRGGGGHPVCLAGKL